jgi:hypothetical protein
MTTILGLKLGRRLTAAVAFGDERIVFHDSRYVPGRRDLRERSLVRYLVQLLAQLEPAHLFYYAPTSNASTTDYLVGLVESVASQRGVPITRLSRADVFDHVGLTPLRTRRELYEHLQLLWNGLDEIVAARRLAFAEAATCAFVGDLNMGLGP